jgi:antitoxin component YwqK of YwqJK toxin-antitoxin module
MLHTEYYRDGTPCECDEMERYYYFPSRALLSETPYVKGKKHGVRRAYFESGALQWLIPFVKGIKHGITKQFLESGALCGEALRERSSCFYRPRENFCR